MRARRGELTVAALSGEEIFLCDAEFAAVARHADLAIAVPSTSRRAVSCVRGVFAQRRRGL
jgi:hypothetical protein